ncbi:MAG: PspC domain-containing protein [Methanothrix sp.]|nr:PspC domain-containing protein [Methanothrix sp.]
MTKKLYRSREDRWVGGVCGGLAKYLDVDPIVIRLIALILVLCAGGGLLVYIIAWIVIPEEPDSLAIVDESSTPVETTVEIT